MAAVFCHRLDDELANFARQFSKLFVSSDFARSLGWRMSESAIAPLTLAPCAGMVLSEFGYESPMIPVMQISVPMKYATTYDENSADAVNPKVIARNDDAECGDLPDRSAVRGASIIGCASGHRRERTPSCPTNM